MWCLSLVLLLLLTWTDSWTQAIPRNSALFTSKNLAPRAVANTTETFITPVSLSSDGESYYAVIQLGDINFRVSLDTASSDLWIVSSSCSSNACKSVPRYPLTYESSTFSAVNGNGTAFSAGYADGTVASGFVARETVHLSNLTLPDQAFALITDSNVTMADQTSGILGLGFPRISTISSSVTNSAPLFPSLAQQGLLEYPLFGLSLTRNETGSLALGAIDGSIVTNLSNIEWNEVVEFAPFGPGNSSSYYQWTIPLESLALNGTAIALSPSYPTVTGNKSLAIFDVGTPGIYGPWQDVSTLFSSFNGARLVDSSGQWAVPCDSSLTMSFTFGTQNFTLQPTDYLIGPASGNPSICLAWPRAVTPSPDGIDWQLGTPFLRTVYSIFSYGIDGKEPPMIGLYPLSNTTAPELPSAVSSFFSSASATIGTTLPNFLLGTPSVTTPAYSLNSSVSAPTGGIISTELATATYSPILVQGAVNLSAIPVITPSPTVATITITNSGGSLSTSTSTLSVPSIVLGVPPGWSTNAGLASRASWWVPFASAVLSIIFCYIRIPDLVS